MVTVYLILGLILLFAGGELLIRGAVALAHRMQVSPLIIGLTIVGFGTSAPELLVSVQSALAGQADIALGNVVGSNIANILLILGAAALIYPLRSTPQLVYRDGSIMVLAGVLLVIVSYFGTICRWAGLLFFTLLLIYLFFTYYLEKVKNAPSAELRKEEAELMEIPAMPYWKSIGTFTIGLGLLLLGSSWLVDSAVKIAQQIGIPERVIGLTLVAIGTSLPELATSVIAAIKKNADVAVGNVLGSNIFNILGILGITAMIEPIIVNPLIRNFDLWVMLGVSVALLPFLITGWQISRKEAALFLVLYGVYMFVIF